MSHRPPARTWPAAGKRSVATPITGLSGTREREDMMRERITALTSHYGKRTPRRTALVSVGAWGLGALGILGRGQEVAARSCRSKCKRNCTGQSKSKKQCRRKCRKNQNSAWATGK